MTDSSSSRRSFLKGAAATTAAAGLAPRAFAGSLPSGRGDGPLRVGLVGCGGRGTGAATQALMTKGDVALVAMADAFSDRLESSLGNLSGNGKIQSRVKVAEEMRFIGFDAYEKLLASNVDVVILATPPHFRPQQFAAAIASGKHVFMEKPVAVDGAGVQQVLEAAKLADQKSLKVGVGLQRHHDAGYQDIIGRVHAGEIGEIVAARAYWNMGYLWHKDRQPGWSDMEWQMRNWLYFTWLSGDHICEQHIHNLDVVNWAKQAHPVKAHGIGGRERRTDPKFGHIFDHHGVHYEYADGSYMFSQCRQIAGCMNKVSEHLIGTKGRADFERGYHIRGHGKDGGHYRYQGKRSNPYQVEHDRLFQAIREGTPHNEAKYGAESTLTAIMGRMATYSGKLVTWDQALGSKRLGPAEYDWGKIEVPPVPRPGN